MTTTEIQPATMPSAASAATTPFTIRATRTGSFQSAATMRFISYLLMNAEKLGEDQDDRE